MKNIIDTIKTELQEPKKLAISAAVLGLLVGLLIGWVIWPVQWVDTNAETMRPDLRVDYMRMVITNYNLTYDQVKALQLYQELGSQAEATLAEVQANPGFLNQDQIFRFVTAVNAGPVTLVPATPNEQANTDAAAAEEGNPLLTLGLILLGLLVVGAALVYFVFYSKHVKTNPAALDNIRPAAVPATARASASTQSIPVNHQPVASPFATRNASVSTPAAVSSARVQANRATMVQEKPIAQFMTTYMFGDDLYDDSFTFDAPNGEFLGECGVSISDTIGVGDPKKISAFEIWLFDKNDIQTVTKVMMSEHNFNEPNLRQRLEIKGEPVLAEPGKLFELETATLRMEARIVDLAYGDLPLPSQSYFQRATVELAVYRR
jgi:hypothetical protein